jgi:predicted amidohydrolase
MGAAGEDNESAVTARIALANVRVATTPDESVAIACAAIREAGARGAQIICFPECCVPGYRWPGITLPPPDTVFLEHAWSTIASCAGSVGVAVVLGTERITTRGLHVTALVINSDGTRAGWQDKVQLDPSEESLFTPGEDRHVFQSNGITFGIAICHEGWRYPETVRWAARRGAQIVFHPHAHIAEPGSYRPAVFADPANTFHEKALLCRAGENTCWIASVNAASEGCGTTSAVIRPDGTVQCYQPYGVDGVLIADIDLSLATGWFASRCRTSPL